MTSGSQSRVNSLASRGVLSSRVPLIRQRTNTTAHNVAYISDCEILRLVVAQIETNPMHKFVY